MLVLTIMILLLSNAVATNKNKFVLYNIFIKILIHFIMVRSLVYILNSTFNCIFLKDLSFLVIPLSLCIVKILLNISRTHNTSSIFTVKYMLMVFLRSLLISFVIIPIFNILYICIGYSIFLSLSKYYYIIIVISYILELPVQIKDLIPYWEHENYEGKGKKRITQEDEDRNEEIEEEKKEVLNLIYDTEDNIEILEDLDEKAKTAHVREDFDECGKKWDEVAGKVNTNMHKLEDLQKSLEDKKITSNVLKRKYEELESRFDKNQEDHYHNNSGDSGTNSDSETNSDSD